MIYLRLRVIKPQIYMIRRTDSPKSTRKQVLPRVRRYPYHLNTQSSRCIFSLDTVQTVLYLKKDRISNMHPISAPYSLGTARYYQELASQYTNSDDIDSISHAHTTVDSYQERMNETKDGSIYSYNSTRDVGLFVREIHGR